MPSVHVHPSDDVAYLCHLLVEVTNGAPVEPSVLHHPAWRSKVGHKGRQRERNGSSEQSRRTTRKAEYGGWEDGGGGILVFFTQVWRNIEMGPKKHRLVPLNLSAADNPNYFASI